MCRVCSAARVIASLGADLVRPSVCCVQPPCFSLRQSRRSAAHWVKCKYRLLPTPRQPRKPDPKVSARELITAFVETKHRNPRFGCRRIAQQLAFMFSVDIDKDVVRRVLAKRYRSIGAVHVPMTPEGP